jgi:hypothetical protein
MWTHRLLILAVATSALLGVPRKGASQENTAPCTITIVSPEHGEMVGRQRIVRGHATFPPDGHLWIFVRVRGIRGWWPQGGGEAEIVESARGGSKWEVVSFFGQQHDIGAQFEILATVVSDGVNQDLEKYVERGVKSSDWPPMQLPNVFQGCTVARITVVKSSH